MSFAHPHHPHLELAPGKDRCDDLACVPPGARKKASLKGLRPPSKDSFSSSGPATLERPGPGLRPAQEVSGRASQFYSI
jgi:hypothetical protein